MRVDVPGTLSADKKLFGEAGGFILEVAPDQISFIKNVFLRYRVPIFIIGKTLKNPQLIMQKRIHLSLVDAKRAFENGLREKLF